MLLWGFFVTSHRKLADIHERGPMWNQIVITWNHNPRDLHTVYTFCGLSNAGLFYLSSKELQWCHNERWRRKSPASRLFTQSFHQAQNQRKHQSSVSLAVVRWIHRWPVNSPHTGPNNAEYVSIWWRHHEWLRIHGIHVLSKQPGRVWVDSQLKTNIKKKWTAIVWRQTYAHFVAYDESHITIYWKE